MWADKPPYHYIGPPRTKRHVASPQKNYDGSNFPLPYLRPEVEAKERRRLKLKESTPDPMPELPGALLFSKLWGSHSHNTALPTSDRDYLMIYVAPTKDVLSLHPPADTVDGKKPDFEAHELRKFCQLLMKGNPSMIECLFTEKFCYTTPAWDELVTERYRFLSQRVVQQYLGYGLGQLKRFDVGTRLHTKGGKQNEKWLYHMIRVLNDALRISQGHEPVVWKEGEEQKLLMRIRTGEMHHENVVYMARQLIQVTDSLKPYPLPPLGDEKFLNEWLLNIRMEGV